MAKKTSATDDILRELRAYGMAYPGTHFKSPWPGHMDLAVKDKTFAYLSLEGEPLAISCKLPRSSAMALLLPFCKPAAYGLGKSGWVAASFAQHAPDVAMLKAWIDESYRAQAPKKLVADLSQPRGTPTTAAAKPVRAETKPVRAETKPARAEAKPARPSTKPARPGAKPPRADAKAPAGTGTPRAARAATERRARAR